MHKKTMNKRYIKPATRFTQVDTELLIAASLDIDSTEGNQLGNTEILVKETHHTYNVWDDDWSRQH